MQLYHVSDLHFLCHGSIPANDLPRHEVLFERFGIEHYQITPQLAYKNGWTTKDGVSATYPDQRVIQQLDDKLVFNLPTLYSSLVLYLLSLNQRTDNRRANHHIKPLSPSMLINILFGFRRLQPTHCPSA